MCDGFVHPVTRVALTGPGGVIRCNRQWDQFEKYVYLFGEECAGSHRLTDAMVAKVGRDRVREPRDIKYTLAHDLLDDSLQ